MSTIPSWRLRDNVSNRVFSSSSTVCDFQPFRAQELFREMDSVVILW